MKNMKDNEKSQRVRILLGFLSIIFGFFLFLLTQYKLIQIDEISHRISIILSLTTILFGIMIFLMNYLKTGNFFKLNESQKITDELLLLRNEFVHNQLSPDKIENMLNEFDDKLNSQKTGSLISSEEKSNIIITLKKSIMDESSNSLLESIEKKFSKDIKRDKFLKDLRRQCGKTRNRLVEEINSLTRRGNLNLIIGVGTTIVAVTILFTTVLSGAKQLSNQELISYYVPRLTLSLFIEVFSFFFLKLYKAGLSEIKYFQNELTNAEMKFIAIEKSVMLEDVESQAKVIQTLSETERNFKLAKGESTVELEKYRSDQANSQAIMESVKGIISGVSNKSNLRN